MKKLISLAVLAASFAAFAAPRCPEIEKAKRHLEDAKAELQKGAHDYKGHRASALEHTNQALNEVEQALAVKGCKP